jgi:hypothetical protein
MRSGFLAAVLVVLGAGACASRPASATLGSLVSGGPSVAYDQPATIIEAIGGRKFTGYVRLGYGEDGRVVVTSSGSAFAPLCTREMAEWNAKGRAGRMPCATVTIELDGEPPNFYLASGWTARPLAKKLAEQMRASVGFAPSVGGAVSAQVVQSPLMSSMIWAMYGGLFELVGAPTPEGCQALRPRDAKTRIDGRCQPAVLSIY